MDDASDIVNLLRRLTSSLEQCFNGVMTVNIFHIISDGQWPSRHVSYIINVISHFELMVYD